MEYLATFPNQLQAMEYARALTRSGIPSPDDAPPPRAGGQLRHGGAGFPAASRWISC